MKRVTKAILGTTAALSTAAIGYGMHESAKAFEKVDTEVSSTYAPEVQTMTMQHEDTNPVDSTVIILGLALAATIGVGLKVVPALEK